MYLYIPLVVTHVVLNRQPGWSRCTSRPFPRLAAMEHRMLSDHKMLKASFSSVASAWGRPRIETCCAGRKFGYRNHFTRQQPIHIPSDPLWDLLSPWLTRPEWLTCRSALRRRFTSLYPFQPMKSFQAAPKMFNPKLGVLAGVLWGDPLTWQPTNLTRSHTLSPRIIGPGLSALELSPWTPGGNELQRHRQLSRLRSCPNPIQTDMIQPSVYKS